MRELDRCVKREHSLRTIGLDCLLGWYTLLSYPLYCGYPLVHICATSLPVTVLSLTLQYHVIASSGYEQEVLGHCETLEKEIGRLLLPALDFWFEV